MNNIFNLVKSFVLSNLGSTLLGLVSLMGLIWLLGPKVGLVSMEARLICMLVLLAVFALGLLIKWLWANRQGGQLQRQITAQEESLAGRNLEIKALKDKMQQAISQLKSSELGVNYRGNAALYALPWYMIIGASASGKSTLLRHSGLNFPFSSQEEIHVQGFGGTRNCDWWFSDEAVILDTAGRYTTEDSDKEEWQSFLKLLKRNRSRLPINGIMVSMSLHDLLTCDEEGVAWHVKVIRERIEELYTQFGFVFPVYLMFTKCDLLQGFTEFFAEMSEEDRKQIWGFNFFEEAEDSQVQLDHAMQSFDMLYEKLCLLRLHKISAEHNKARKFTLYQFPDQFKAMRER